MGHEFPSAAWLAALHEKLNSDEQYGQIARNWEGDVLFTIQQDSVFAENRQLYFDLWHGKCRSARIVDNGDLPDADFTLRADYSQWLRVLKGELHPMQAMLTQKLKLEGSMSYLMRHVPTVLDFTRCAQEVTAF